ncbi:MAG: flagellar basal body P-ring formation chaperone FlgA [Verrucomicrobia bacterium]|nr:flagellar basal body P-ring formation chaperone FlgA [Verrucomicrobiota bacterium]
MKLSLSILIELLLGVASLAAQSSGPKLVAPEPLVAVFANGAMVHSEGVFSTDLIQGVPALPRVRVAPAPQVGAWSQLSRTSVVEALRIAGVDLSLVRWTGPESARVSRAMRDLGEAEVRDRITQELQRRFARNGGEIEVRLSRPWRPVSIPDESLDIRLLDLPTAGLQSLISLKVEGLVGGDVVGSWFQPIQVRHWCEVPVAAAALRRGQPLVEVETVLERRDVLVSRGILKALPKAVQDYELAEGLAPGQALSDRSLRLKTVVFRGRRVDARIQAGTLEITTKVEALEDGYPGQSIRVRNPLSKREFRGVVQGEDSVLIPL